MNQKLFELYANRFKASPSLPNWADLMALTIWQKIEFCRYTALFNLHENSVTQELIYSFWQLAASQRFPVQIYQSKNEKANGNDIEIAIQTKHGYLLFPAQAKIVDNKGRYPSIRHKVGGKKQIDLLLDYGKKIGGIPIYLFYNFGSDPYSNQAFQRLRLIEIERLGCSVFPAQFIKNNFNSYRSSRWSTPEFYDVHHRLTIPFSNLFELVNNTTMPGVLLDTFSSGSRFYSEPELTNDTNWEDLAPGPRIGRISEERSVPETRIPEEDNLSFNPGFRILFPIERKRTIVISN